MGHEHTTKKLGWTILFNIVITFTEYIGGILSGSLALLADAGHNFSDVLSLILGYIGERFSEKEVSPRHTFGFKRVEIFTALINALALLAVGGIIIVEAARRYNDAQEVNIALMLGVGIIGLLGNALSILFLFKEKEGSLNMKAAYLHLFYDTLSSVAVIVGGVIMYFTGFLLLDLVVSVIIALLILWSGFEVVKKAVHILMQGVPEDLDVEEVYNALLKVPGVQGVHSMHLWAIDSSEPFFSCHLCAERGGDALIKRVNAMLAVNYGINHTTLQLEKKLLCTDAKLCTRTTTKNSKVKP